MRVQNTKAFFASGGPPGGVGEETTTFDVVGLTGFGEELLLFVESFGGRGGGGRGGGGGDGDVLGGCWESIGESGIGIGIGRGGSDC